MYWRILLEGDVDRYKEIISRREEQFIKDEYSKLIHSFNNEQKSCNLADRIICLCKDTYTLLLSTYKVSNEELKMINNGVSDLMNEISESEKQQIRVSLQISQDEKILLYVGRVEKTKGGIALLKCFTNVLSEYPNCRLVIMGNLRSNEILNQIGNSASKISFTGHIEKEEAYKWYSITDMGIVASYAEQCSYFAMEMMMHRSSVAASDGYGVRNMFKDPQNAIVARIGDRENDDEYCNNLAQAIIKFLKSERLRNNLSKENKTLFENIYKIEHM